MPGIISQVGTHQYEYLKKLQADIKTDIKVEPKKESKKEEVVRQVTQMLAQSKTASAGQDKPGLPAASMKVPSIVFGMVLLGLLVLKAEWIPLAIVLWVVWNVRRLLRSAKAASSAKTGS